MKHRNLGKFLIAAASISMAVSPITAFANTAAPVVIAEGEAAVDPTMLLDEAINYADEQSTENVVKKVKDNFTAKLAAAKAVATNADPSATEINTAWSELVDAIHYLSFTGDHAGLTAAIAEKDTLTESDYTAESWAAYVAAVDAAKTVNADENALDAELAAEVTKLVDAKNALVAAAPTPTVDKTALKAAIAAAEAKKADGKTYTEDSLAALDAALDAAKGVDAKEDATEAEVTKATQDLTEATVNLQVKDDEPGVDKTALKDALDSQKVTHDAYNAEDDAENKIYLTEDSIAAYDKAAEDGQAVYDKEDATEEEVKNAVDALKAAKDELAQNIYRAYNPNNGEHLFTVNEKEYNFLSANGWKAEDIAWIAPFDGRGMTRMYDENSGEHHYTSNPQEIAGLEGFGWKNEGVKWFSASKEDGIVIHRLYNPNETRAGRHHYTLVDREKDFLDANGWNWENDEANLFYAKAAPAEE